MFEEPEFHVHLGYNGRQLALHAIENNYADGVILSPVDFGISENREIAGAVKEQGGRVLFDPQFYNPRSEIDELQGHPYFFQYGGNAGDPQETLTQQGDFDTEKFEDAKERRNFCRKLAQFQNNLKEDTSVDAFISPSRYLRSFSEANLRWWQDLTETFLEVANDVNPEKPVFASLPLNGELLQEDDQPGRLLNWITSVDVDGFYPSVSQDIGHQYPMTGRATIQSYLNLIRHLKLSRYEILLGHSHHVAYLFLGIGVDAFATGHYNNLRTLDMSRFDETDSGGGRMVMKYYSDPSLNDLRARSPSQIGTEEEEVEPADVSDIDLLSSQGFDLDRIREPTPFDEDLFREGIMASETDWGKIGGEGYHYIHSCYQISRRYHDSNLESELEDVDDLQEARLQYTEKRLNEAESLFLEIRDEHGLQLVQPNQTIYSDWKNAFKTVANEIR